MDTATATGRYRQLPKTVTAMRFDRDRPGFHAELQAFIPGCDIGPAHVRLPDGQRAEQGMWIIKDRLGNLSVARDLEFRATHEPE